MLLLLLGVAGATIAGASLLAMKEAVDIPLGQGDGAYQTASGLHRLAAGQWPGQDFFPYLGLGLLYFIFPFFVAAGSNMAGTVFASHLTVYLATLTGAGITGALLVPRNRVVVGILVIGSLSAVILLYQPWLSPVLQERIVPGNSLRPLRSFIPYITAAGMLWVVLGRTPASLIYKALLLGLLSGLAFSWSNDYGVPSAGLFGLLAMGWVWKQPEGNLWRACLVPLVALATAAMFMTLATAGNPVAMFNYNLGVSHDQYWYFPCWAEHCRVFSTGDVLRKYLVPIIGWWHLVLFAVAASALWFRSIALALLTVTGLALYVGGMLTATAGHIEHGYAAPFIFWCITVLCLAPLAAISHLLDRHSRAWLLVAGLLVLQATILALPRTLAEYRFHAYSRASAPEHYHYSPELGGFLPINWKDYLELASLNADASVVEDYWGIWSAATRARTDYPVDSVIHALGPARDRFREELLAQQPEIFITASLSYVGYWNGWLLGSSWWFFQPLLQNYERVSAHPTTDVWRRGEHREWPTVGCQVTMHPEPLIVLDSDVPGYYEVSFDYDARSLNRSTLLHMRTNMNYAVDAQGDVSIDSRARQWTLPVAIIRSGDNQFGFRLTTRSDHVDQVHLEGCTARRIVADGAEMLPRLPASPQSAPLDLTDDRWIRGISRWEPGLLASNTGSNRERLAPGNFLRFYDGYSAQIARLKENGEYLEVYLHSDRQLHGGYGFPIEFSVSKP